MSQENVDQARAGYAALNQALAGGDISAFVREAHDPEIVMEMGALEGTVRGQDGVVRFFEGQQAVLDDMRAEPEEFIDAGDRVVVVFRLIGRVRSTGLPFEDRYVHVLTFRGGKVIHVRLYANKDKALEAVGLRE
jgi:ketosteroid isomerase-like protein